VDLEATGRRSTKSGEPELPKPVAVTDTTPAPAEDVEGGEA
jgi:hypothetical protein